MGFWTDLLVGKPLLTVIEKEEMEMYLVTERYWVTEINKLIPELHPEMTKVEAYKTIHKTIQELQNNIKG